MHITFVLMTIQYSALKIILYLKIFKIAAVKDCPLHFFCATPLIWVSHERAWRVVNDKVGDVVNSYLPNKCGKWYFLLNASLQITFLTGYELRPTVLECCETVASPKSKSLIVPLPSYSLFCRCRFCNSLCTCLKKKN